MEKAVRIIFFIRILLWTVALAASFYWIYWSFHLYNIGIFDVHEYASYLRPIFWKGFLISIAAVCVSLVFRSISDKLKKRINQKKYELNSETSN